MSAIDVVGPPPSAAAPQAPLAPMPAANRGRFLGSEGAFFGLLARGAVLLMLTLGIYRFWLTTDVRRFLWGNTEVGGDGLEYTGTAKELLIGFLLAIVLLVPINALIFLGTLAPSLLPFSGTVGFILLALLGQFAVYRARRYRLSRTIYRGVRFFQTGAAWRYSIRSNVWSVIIVLTAGLAYPWAQANLERYKMRHAHYGNLDGRFVGSGTRLFFRGLLLWLIVMGPLVLGFAKAVAAIDWAALAEALSSREGNQWARIQAGNPDIGEAAVYVIGGLIWSVLAAILLYPMFRAIVLRWWISGLRMGDVSVRSRLRTGQVYALYARFLGFSALFGLVVGIAAAVAAIAFKLAGGYIYEASQSFGTAREIAIAVLAVMAYVIVMLGYSTVYHATVTIRLWRLSFEMTEFAGLETLDRVEARGAASGPLGEGLADALDVGGI